MVESNFEHLLRQQRIFKGTVEVEDQAEGFTVVSSQVDFLDTSRVGVMGWSYGGFAV